MLSSARIPAGAGNGLYQERPRAAYPVHLSQRAAQQALAADSGTAHDEPRRLKRRSLVPSRITSYGGLVPHFGSIPREGNRVVGQWSGLSLRMLAASCQNPS